ncbi:metallophosphoesterase [Streptomyces sp. NPDC058676]|uniref:metallophosphoesterase n=1 Tax=unclassified Streptomyces TaxID=2593676 RepID=UPI003651B1CC
MCHLKGADEAETPRRLVSGFEADLTQQHARHASKKIRCPPPGSGTTTRTPSGEETGRGPDLEGALRGRDTSRPVVLLAHQPVFAEEAARHGVDLQLSGHTHGGQMFPLTAVTAMSSPVTAGLGSVDDTTLYVTSGAGFFGPPVRVGAPADISLLELRPQNG